MSDYYIKIVKSLLQCTCDTVSIKTHRNKSTDEKEGLKCKAKAKKNIVSIQGKWVRKVWGKREKKEKQKIVMRWRG